MLYSSHIAPQADGRREPVHDQDNEGPRKRQYPPLYEKLVPIALGALVLIVILLLLVILAVLAGLFPTGS